jgi:ketosteroid isomerase-like protein
MTDSRTWLDRLVRATNAHDLDALVECFAADYVNVSPAHPQRGFVGRQQVRRNWEQIFAAVPDIRAEVVAVAFDGDTAWTQWVMRGTRADGSGHHVAGIIVFEIAGDTARRATFCMEPVEEDFGSVDDVVRSQVLR